MKAWVNYFKNKLSGTIKYIGSKWTAIPSPRNMVVRCKTYVSSFFNAYSPRTKALLYKTTQSKHMKKWLLFTAIQNILIAYSFYSLSLLDKVSNGHTRSEMDPEGNGNNDLTNTGQATLLLNMVEILKAALPIIGSIISETYANYHLKHAKLDAVKDYVEEFTQVHARKAILFKNKTYRTAREAYIVGGEGNKFVSKSIDYFTNLVETALSILSNSSAWVMKATSNNVYLIYPALMMATVSTYFLFKKNINVAFQISAENQRKLNTNLMDAWDNITIGNDFNLNLWQQSFNENFKQHKKASPYADLFLKQITFLLTQINSLPFLYISYKTASLRLSDLVNLGKSQRDLSMLFHLMLQWQVFLACLESTDKSLSIIDFTEQDYLDHIQFDKIQIYDNTKGQDIHCKNIAEFSKLLELFQSSNDPRRITLRGDNGVGKSVLLAYTKDTLMQNAMLVPASSQLSFSRNEKSASTGQAILRQYGIIKDKKLYKNKILLGDEWDANLDENHVQTLNNTLDEISKESVVVEVRHRGIKR